VEVFKSLFIVFMTVHTAMQVTPLEPKLGVTGVMEVMPSMT